MLPRNDPDRIQITFDDHRLETGPESPGWVEGFRR